MPISYYLLADDNTGKAISLSSHNDKGMVRVQGDGGLRILYIPLVRLLQAPVMKSVNISYLRQHLPEFIAMVAEGVSVSITLRGKPVAQLLPIAPAPDAVATARSRLRGSVLRYDDPLAPVLPSDEWDMNR